MFTTLLWSYEDSTIRERFWYGALLAGFMGLRHAPQKHIGYWGITGFLLGGALTAAFSPTFGVLVVMELWMTCAKHFNE